MPLSTITRTRFIAVAATVAASITLAACGGSGGGGSNPGQSGAASGGISLIKPGQLTVCTHMSYKPFQFKQDGKIVGFDVDLMDLVAKDLGVTQQITDIEFRQIYDGTAFATKKCDLGAAGMTITDARKKTVLFSEPYFDATQALLVKKSSGITNMSQMRGKKLGAQTETTGLDYAQKDKETNGYEVVIFDDLPLSVNSVKSGRVDGAINDNGVLYDFAKDNPDTTVVQEFSTGESYGISAKLNDPSAQALIAKVNAAISKAKSDGTYNQIYKKWFGVEPGAKAPGASGSASPSSAS